MSKEIAMIGVVVLMCCSSSIAAVMRSGGDDTEIPTGPSSIGPSQSLGSPRSSPPPPPPSYIEVFGVDYPGNDIKHIQNTTIENCKAECDADPACTLIATNNNGDLCWLKSGAKNMAPNTNIKNFFKPNGPWDVNDKFKLVRAGALCTGNASYSSVAWALLKSGEPQKFADWNSEGDKLYKTYIERGLDECDKDPNCKYVNVWRDAGYRKYDGSNCPDQRRDDWTSAFKKIA